LYYILSSEQLWFRNLKFRGGGRKDKHVHVLKPLSVNLYFRVEENKLGEKRSLKVKGGGEGEGTPN